MLLKQLSLYSCLDIKPPAVVSFFGAGGKTTLINLLAAEMNALGLKTLITTTTRIAKPLSMPFFCFPHLKTALEPLKKHYRNHSTAVLGAELLAEGKLSGVNPNLIEDLSQELGVTVLVEADGSRGLPLKGYADHEPALPASSEYIIAVAGADAIYKPLNQNSVHRPAQLKRVIKGQEKEIITEKTVSHAFKHMLELGEQQACRAKPSLVLNKVDLLDNPSKTSLNVVNQIAPLHLPANRLFSTEARNTHPVKYNLGINNREKTVSLSCVVLAAGESSRMGTDKLALKIKDKTILELTLEQINAAEIEDIIVVVRPGFNKFACLKNSGHKIIENNNFQKELSQSLKLGLGAVDNKSQGVIFALADQPLIPPVVYKLISEHYLANLKPVTIPAYRGRRGNPVLFDRNTWPALMKLEGDEGGRQLIKSLPENEIDQVETAIPEILFDIDTPEDYNFLNK